MMCRLASTMLVAAAMLAAGPHGAAAQDVLAQARGAPTRAEGIVLLEARLADAPRDVDARLLYALMLSWDGRYDEARRQFDRVLEQAPNYTDARVGLMNVEWWSGRRAAARDQANTILARDPGHPQARLVRQRLDAASRPWTAKAMVGYERFNDGRQPWREQMLSLTRETPVGSVIARATRAERFGLEDQQFEIEFYPSLRPGTYAFIGAGGSADRTLYPRRRMAVDLYQSLGRGFEVSGGYRRLDFSQSTSIYVGSLTKYVGNWMLTGRVYRVPAPGSLDSTSGHALVRRYFGGDGSSYVGVGYSQGLSREEIRGLGDLIALDSQTFRGQADAALTSRLRLQVEASSSRQERTSGLTLWQTAVSTGISVRF
jgi:YaiO family outer membrane protein